MSERWFTSDLHFGHVNIIKYCNRPWATVDEMNEGLIENWNATVAPADHVWVLGDVAMGKITETLPLAKRLNGVKHLVPGNHDRCWTGHKKGADKWAPFYAEVGFIIEPNEVECTIGDRPTLLCHFPYSGDSRHEERYSDARPTDNGRALVHGHVHDIWKVRGREINVGTDVWDYRPVNRDEIADIVRSM